MSGCTAPALPMPHQRTASHAHSRTARRLPADGNRRPVAERCSHHQGCNPGCTPNAAQVTAHNGAPLWRTMMERWLTAAP
ncbi:hypothetical protein ABNQ39_14750 [Azospirillum sp. A26]|uniref:Uncharacterized protein n=1 Tax=Azospirillum palustre TaxID=2044885 RepID=A0A2B8B9H0_9PROT|nr:hypothetical protein [Azospirillum palustre]PGH54571.1 hypothetical protein CRT60_32925 [Azospirillum palustre]